MKKLSLFLVLFAISCHKNFGNVVKKEKYISQYCIDVCYGVRKYYLIVHNERNFIGDVRCDVDKQTYDKVNIGDNYICYW